MATGQLVQRGQDAFLLRVFVGRDAEGKRRYLNETVRGSKRQAQQRLTKLLNDRNIGALVEPTRLTVAQYLKRWLDTSVKPQCRERTLLDYRHAVDYYVAPILGPQRLGRLSAPEVRALYGGMTARGLSSRTVRKVHSVLHAALEQAVRDRLLAHNVAHLAKDALPRRERHERTVLGAEDAARFVAALQGKRLAAYWLLLLTGGLRPGEALALRWSDLEGNRLHVQRSLVDRSGKVRYEEPKTSKSRRTVPLPVSTVEALKVHRRAQAVERLRAGSAYKDDGLIFCTRTGTPLRQSNLSRWFQTFVKRAKLPPLRVYDLRHSCATLLLKAGESPKIVAERLGHASITLTLDTYSHVLPDMQEQAATKLQALVFT